ncbi:hypothetical protein ESCO_000746 [Escovopsis weberi]|uniref:Uncharacterized protein n=1 Tax=Escovopsis weberi TaxID=150374 RepID=A0A0M8N3V5_ESCWE|nr:hypothetical protein ESCO_000746 [Escovopsis weberi]
MIGITLPPEEAATRDTQPRMGGFNTLAPTGQQIPRKPLAAPSSRPPAGRLDTTADANEPKSVWSPDTPDTACSFASIRPPSSVYSQMTMPGNALGLTSFGAPPVPALPATFHPTAQQKLLDPRLGLGKNLGEDDDDVGTPCTLFEEDGAPAARGSSHPEGNAIH